MRTSLSWSATVSQKRTTTGGSCLSKLFTAENVPESEESSSTIRLRTAGQFHTSLVIGLTRSFGKDRSAVRPLSEPTLCDNKTGPGRTGGRSKSGFAADREESPVSIGQHAG